MNKDLIIAGGGITGLTVAYTLEKEGYPGSITLVEVAPKLGGKIDTIEEEGFLVEKGPDGFVSFKPAAMELVKELGLSGEIILPEKSKFYILRNGRLKNVPEGMASMVPKKPGDFLRSSLFSLSGKLRIISEPFIPSRKTEEDESLGEFIRRRFGKEMLVHFAEPLFTGVYATPANQLSLLATFPHFRRMEREYGSITKAILAARKKYGSFSGPVFRSFKHGMKVLPESLEKNLKKTRIKKGVKVEKLQKKGTEYRVRLNDGKELSCSNVVLTLAAVESIRLIGELEPQVSGLAGSFPRSSSVVISLAFKRRQLQMDLDATGFLIPGDEKTNLTACTWSSAKWANRAPGGYMLLRCFFGQLSKEDVERYSDQDWSERAVKELQKLLPVMGNPEKFWVNKWIDAQPQYFKGHLDHVNTMENILEQLPGLYITGSSYRGVGVPDCIDQGKNTAGKIIQDI